MLLSVVAVLALSMTVQVDTVVILGMVERDLTADGRPEVLRLVGVGESVDSLDVTFSIESSGRTVFQTPLSPMIKTVGFDAGRRELSSSEHRARLREFGDWFFGDAKFKRPDEFVAEWRRQASAHVLRIPEVIDRDRRYQLAVDSLIATGYSRAEAERSAPSLLGGWGAAYDSASAVGIWQEIQSTGVTVFEFSPGGDAVTAIAWSVRDRRLISWRRTRLARFWRPNTVRI
jgi:hypothetical protein